MEESVLQIRAPSENPNNYSSFEAIEGRRTSLRPYK
jgi:hypothetical protein